MRACCLQNQSSTGQVEGFRMGYRGVMRRMVQQKWFTGGGMTFSVEMRGRNMMDSGSAVS